ncbi:UNVERIFIED_CONTAM: Acyl-CoA-binding domain-containing protein 5 [Sesamum calycinum]|uniref:Acyl-CoA-binding domain-containing protein 5 n=1 Tax=Sesamum calycinum TaxID=2727403 RepID=A0AAW2RRM5_9LAMI
MGTDSQNWQLDLSYDQWVALPVSGQRLLRGTRDFIAFLPCFKVFDLKSLTWSTIKLNMETDDMKVKVLSHLKVFQQLLVTIKWKTRLLLLAGLSKNTADRVTVWFIDLESHNWGVAESFGNVPRALFIELYPCRQFEESCIEQVHVVSMTCSIQTPPTPRFDHVATLHAERYLFVFGGCSHSVFFNDLHVLDLETMEWSQPQVQGDLVTPRAGHAGVAVEGNWFIVGGGDNKSGALETLVINLSKLVVSVVTSVKGRDPLASEGISISSASLGGENFLVTFGGYNGKYYNEVFVMRVKPRDSLHPKILQSPAAAAAAASVTAAYALAKAESLDFPEKEDSNAKTKIDEANGNYNELSKELHSVQGQLVAERSRCAKLEFRARGLVAFGSGSLDKHIAPGPMHLPRVNFEVLTSLVPFKT